MPVARLVPDHLPEALRLLPRAAHGRAAVTRRALPYVLLAQHLVDGDEVLLRIPGGQIEPRMLDGTVLAYHAHPCAEWTDDAPGVQLVGTVTTVRPTPRERAAFPRRGPGAAARPAGGDGTGADRPDGDGADATGEDEDPDGTLYARLAPVLAAIRP